MPAWFLRDHQVRRAQHIVYKLAAAYRSQESLTGDRSMERCLNITSADSRRSSILCAVYLCTPRPPFAGGNRIAPAGVTVDH